LQYSSWLSLRVASQLLLRSKVCSRQESQLLFCLHSSGATLLDNSHLAQRCIEHVLASHRINILLRVSLT
jgi:hypothetical protein